MKTDTKCAYFRIHTKFNLGLAIIVAIALLYAIFAENNNIRIIGLTLDFYILIDSFIFLLVTDHNLKGGKVKKNDIHR